MATVIGVWLALSGVPPVIAGLVAGRRVRRLRRDGVKAWAVAVPMSCADGELQVALQYTLADGRVREKLPPPAVGQKVTRRPGGSVLIWYDPADPLDVLVYGHEGDLLDLVLLITGAVCMLAGAGIATLVP